MIHYTLLTLGFIIGIYYASQGFSKIEYMKEESRIDLRLYPAVRRIKFDPYISLMLDFLDPSDCTHLLSQLEILLNIDAEELDIYDAKQKKLIRGRFCMYEFKRIVSESTEDANDCVAIKAFVFGRKSLPDILAIIDYVRRN